MTIQPIKFTIFVMLVSVMFNFPMIAKADQKYADQSDVVVASCKNGKIKYFPNIQHYNEMCRTLKLIPFVPSLPTGWLQEEINWRVKFDPNVSGFHETKELEGVFGVYKIYPFMKYSNEKTKGLIYLLGTITPENVGKMQKEFMALHAKDASSLLGNTDVRYYIDEKERFSIYDRKKTFRMGSISLKDKAFLVAYVQGESDISLIKQMIEGIDYKAITTLVSTLQLPAGVTAEQQHDPKRSQPSLVIQNGKVTAPVEGAPKQ